MIPCDLTLGSYFIPLQFFKHQIFDKTALKVYTVNAALVDH